MIDRATLLESMPTELWLGGLQVPASTGARFAVHDPATDAVLIEVADASPADGARALESALRARPGDAACRYELGRLLARHGRTEAAVKTLQLLEAGTPERSRSLPLLRRCLVELGLDEAARTLREEMARLGVAEDAPLRLETQSRDTLQNLRNARTLLDAAAHEGRVTLLSSRYHLARCALLDADDNPVPQGEVGEVCVSGPLLSGGYWKLPEETAKTYWNGWLRTGDMAREDEDGYWFIVDRVKDVIVTGGFNVYPREVEDVVAEHPSVAQVCVVGAPDEKWGETVTAVVVLRPDADASEAGVATMTEQIQASVKDRKGSVQVPKQVVVVDALPLTGLGKPDKKAVRARFWEGAARAVG